MNKQKYRLTLEMSREINDMVEVLKERHFINMSAFVRKTIVELYYKLKKYLYIIIMIIILFVLYKLNYYEIIIK